VARAVLELARTQLGFLGFESARNEDSVRRGGVNSEANFRFG
jgi:hypothetical protein